MPLGKNPTQSRPVPPESVDRIIHKLFVLFARLYHWRKDHPWWDKVALGVPSFAISFWLSPVLQSRLTHPLLSKLGITIGNQEVSMLIDKYALNAVLALFSFIILWITVTFLAVSERAIAVHKLGLVQASTEENSIHHLLSWYLAQPGIHPDSERIRVICISRGNTLFATENAPLRKWASRGLLDVVMPICSETNSTVSERYRKYNSTILGERYKELSDRARELLY